MRHYDLEEEVVISGIGCKLPESESLEEFAEKLFSGQNMVTRDDRKLSQGLFENLPEYSGKIRHTRKFDLTFFGISNFVVQCMDPMTHQILERTFEAVMDAGMNPWEMRGTDTAVFSGTSISDFDLEWASNYRGGYGIMGRNRCMNANRVSYWLDLKGTSVSLDSTWANGLSNLMNGWEAVKKGRCDAAIVSAASLQSNAEIAIQLNDLGQLSPNGICRSFDDSADGYARSDAVVVLVLQRASMARRSYATIEHVFAKCLGHRDNIVHKPLQEHWEQILEEFYAESKINPDDICYLEGHGCGVKDEDEAELNAVTNFFCRNRTSPLLIGSVKSNMGHAESASASCSILKALVCLKQGIIPQNLNFSSPNSACRGFQSGKLKVVDRNTPLPDEGLIAVNSHGFGGVFAHLVLRRNEKRKVSHFDGLPRLLLLAGRTNELLDSILNKVEAMPFDPEYISLLNEINSKKVDKYLGRGYTILPKKDGHTLRDVQIYNEIKRPVWFIFSGMGSQWPQMGKRLMALPIFRESIEKCHKILEPKGLDLMKIINDNDPKIFDNILHSFVGIAAIQIALVDLLNALRIVPDGMIGHSVGELGCAYADGCFTAEQMMLSAYSRGRASIESDLIRGYMAAIGKGYSSIKDELPDGIEVACHNAADSCTISGPAEKVQEYVKQLESRGIFAKTVNVSNIAYHSRYIKRAAPRLLKYLKEVIPVPKLRSAKWVSTSNLEKDWNTDLARYCSAEYHTNNLLSSVLFEEGSKHIPNDAICIEIAPHGLLQAILKRSLGENCVHVPLTRRTADDPLNFLLQAIGKLFTAGLQPQILNLYPKVEYPVSRGTPSIHQLVHWDHEADLRIAQTRAEKKVIYSFKSHFLKTSPDGTGYIINGENTYPASIFLHLVWSIFATFKKKKMEECPVKFENIRIECPMIIHPSKNDEGMITLQKGTGDFEINTTRLLARGNISLLSEEPADNLPEDFDVSHTMTKEEIYGEIQRKDVDVGESWKPLLSIHVGAQGWRGELKSDANWMQMMESLFQIQIMQLGEESESPLFPKSFEKMCIFPEEYLKFKALGEPKNLVASYSIVQNITACPGLMIKGFKAQELPPSKNTFAFTNQRFVPFVYPSLKDIWQYVHFCFGIVADNVKFSSTPDQEVNVLQVGGEKSMAKYIEDSFPHLKLKVLTAPAPQQLESRKTFDVIVCSFDHLVSCTNLLNDRGFLLVSAAKQETEKLPVDVGLLSKYAVGDRRELVLLRKRSTDFECEPEFVTVPKNEAALVNTLRGLTPKDSRPLFLLTPEEPECGIEQLQQRVQAETTLPLRWVLLLGKKSGAFDSAAPDVRHHLRHGLVTNVFCNGQWGFFLRRDHSQEQWHSDYLRTTKLSNELTGIFLGFDFSRSSVEFKQVEFVGRCRDGQKIMGLGKVLEDKNIIRDKILTWNLPNSWNLEDGVTIPLSYVFSYYCIVMVGNLKKYESVLVTDGCTPIGMAAIQVGLSIASGVYVTVSNEAEAQLVRNRYPSLPARNIFCHDDKHFHIQLGIATGGKYPEMMINTLQGDRFFNIVSCLPSYGRIFHFGDDDYKKNSQLGTSIFLGSTSFHSVSQDVISKMKDVDKQILHQLIEMGMRDGVVKPLPKKMFQTKDFLKALREPNNIPRNVKVVLSAETADSPRGRMIVDSDSSYLIIGDETEVWIDVMRCLIRKGARKIVVSHEGSARSAERHSAMMKKYNVLLFDSKNGKDTESLLKEARQLGPLAAVFVITLKSGRGFETLRNLDKVYRDEKGCLAVISKESAVTGEICSLRNDSGFPSTNFVWGTDLSLLGREIEIMNNLCGTEAIFRISQAKKGSLQSDSAERMLRETLPTAVGDFCNVGSALSEEVKIKELPSLGGLNGAPTRELAPLIFIGGLQNDPVQVLLPLAKQMLYPTVCVRLPHVKLSVKKMVSFILPKIFEVNKNCDMFNIVGISWGCYIAIELARQLEEIGKNVGLILIDCPHQNLKQSLASNGSWESDVLAVIADFSKTIERDKLAADKTWNMKVNRIITTLNLSEEEENDFRRGVEFIHNSLSAFMEYDIAGTKLLGPLTVVKSGQRPVDDRTISQMCNCISVRHLPLESGKLLVSKELRELILGSAITQSMSSSTVHMCSWRNLEDFLIQQKLSDFNSMTADFRVTATKLKFSFTH